MGARPEDYERASPYKSYIHVDDFEGPKELAEFLKKLEENDNEDQIRLVCISDTHCQVFCPNFVQGYKYTKPGRDYVGASSRRRHLDTLWRLHQLWEEGGGGEVQ